MNDKKRITKYLKNQFCILIPVYYEFETAPAWRKVFVGNMEECEKAFNNYPDFLRATNAENIANRKNKLQEILFLQQIGKCKDATALKKQYGFI